MDCEFEENDLPDNIARLVAMVIGSCDDYVSGHHKIFLRNRTVGADPSIRFHVHRRGL